jgi:hypothetical protein
MPATLITTSLENGATLDVPRAAGHAEPGTTKLYEGRGYNPEKSEGLLRFIECAFTMKNNRIKHQFEIF